MKPRQIESIAQDLVVFLDGAVARYLGLQMDELLQRIEQDFPPDRRLADRLEVHFKPDAVDDITAMILPLSGVSALTLFGRETLEGLVVQQERDGNRVVDVLETGSDLAAALADRLVHHHSARYQPGMAATYSGL